METSGKSTTALWDRVAASKVVVCVGPGGVGKTSTSAALAIEAARSGRRTIVLTIDPARRLADALGLPEIGNEERPVSDASFERLGLPPARGRLTAMMLDVKQTWDEVIVRHHPDAKKGRKLLENRFYQSLSTALAGSQEYMAMEKLYELTSRTKDPLDLIVLDTPPAANALDFLEAPSRMLNALDNEATRWLTEPYSASGRISNKLFDAGSSFLIRTIGRFTGAEVLQDLAELLSHFQGMYEGFRRRAAAVRALLSDPKTTFFIISSPRPSALAMTLEFWERLNTSNIPIGALVLNRARVDPFRHQSEDVDALASAVKAAGGSDSLADRIRRVTSDVSAEAQVERRAIQSLEQSVAPLCVVVVPELAGEVHDLAALHALGRHLLGEMLS